jgi:hypothetical protein
VKEEEYGKCQNDNIIPKLDGETVDFLRGKNYFKKIKLEKCV